MKIKENKMTLEQLAQQAMDYLDSVGVAADYEIGPDDAYLYIETNVNDGMHMSFQLDDHDAFMAEIKSEYPLKSPT